MTFRALTLDDLAREFGRGRDWMSDHWRDLVATKKLPPPLVERGPPTWDAAQVYALRDKHLPAAVRANAAAIRAAFDAASQPTDPLYHDDVAEDRKRLDTRFGGSQ